MHSIDNLFNRLLSTKIAKDSVWSVGGNAISLLILLISGIIISRMVGKDAYGQYGTVKNLMMAFASLVAFGFGYSSTKIISSKNEITRGTSWAIIKIVFFIGIILNIILFYLSKPLAVFLNKPDLETFFVAIGILMILRALWATSCGLLAGYKLFKQISLYNIISSIVFAIFVVPLISLYGLYGAILSLILYQALDAFLCFWGVWRYERKAKYEKADSYELLKYSFPIAIHEFSHTFGSISVIMIILHFTSYGEYALYSVSAQWNSVIIIIPTLMMNVTLSYLSNTCSETTHKHLFKKMLLVNLCCSIIPMFLVLLCSGFIVALYGETFCDLPLVLKIGVFSTLFSSLVLVFQSNLISEQRNWNLALYKILRELFYIICLVLFFKYVHIRGALIAVIVDLVICIAYFLLLCIDYSWTNRKKS